MRLPTAAFVIVLVAAGVARAAETPIAREFRLGDAAAPLGYEATLAIDPAAERFEGEVRIRFRMKAASPRLWLHALDIKVSQATLSQGGREQALRVVEGTNQQIGFEVAQGEIAAGEGVATIRYSGPFENNSTSGLFRQREAGDWYVVSQFEDDHARRAVPSFDEPGWKVPWQLTIDAPKGLVVVSNTPELAASDAPGRAGWTRHKFAATPPLPTYLVAMAVGPFDVVDGGTAGRKKTPLRYLAMRGRGAEMRYAKESTPRVLELLEAYFDMPYPFEKLDSVSIAQTVGFGAMENPGMITYVSTLIHAKPNEETADFRQFYTAVAAHEIAHMWFGDLVTLAWWDDVWLNESFASWLGRKVTRQYDPAWDTGWSRNFSRQRAINADRLPSARRIHNPVLKRDDINASFDRLTYDKGSEVLTMFESWLGTENFRRGVRNYLVDRSWGSATSRDFFDHIGKAANRTDAALAAFDGFVNQPGVPLVDASLQCAPGEVPKLVTTQQRLVPAGATLPPMHWTTPACFAVEGLQGPQCGEITDGVASRAVGPAGSCPAWVVGNAGGGGHYILRPDAALHAKVVAALPRISEYEATAIMQDASLLERSGLISLERALETLRPGLEHASPSVRRAAADGLNLLPPAHLKGKGAAMKADLDDRVAVPLATSMGWMERPNESDIVRGLRATLLPYAAQAGAGGPLRDEARKLALQWVSDRGGADAGMLVPILDTAARYADEATYTKLETEALRTKDLRERKQLLAALAKVRDPKLQQRALARGLEQREGQDVLSGRDVLLLVEDALEDDGGRSNAFAFVRTHYDALAAKVPPETPGNFARSLERLCTAGDRAAFVDFFGERAPRLNGGAKKYRQALDSIDICVASTP